MTRQGHFWLLHMCVYISTYVYIALCPHRSMELASVVFHNFLQSRKGSLASNNIRTLLEKLVHGQRPAVPQDCFFGTLSWTKPVIGSTDEQCKPERVCA